MSATGQLSHQFPNEPELANRLTPKLRLDQTGENVFSDASVQERARGLHEFSGCIAPTC